MQGYLRIKVTGFASGEHDSKRKEEYSLPFHSAYEIMTNELNNIWDKYSWIEHLEFTVDTSYSDPDKPPFGPERKEVNNFINNLDGKPQPD